MEEQPIVAARASVMIYDDDNKKWIHSGTSTGVSKVHIYQHITQNTFRVVGRKLHDHELVINCSIIKGLKYNKATPTFHQWRDTKQVYGLNFSTKEDAENFANSMFKVLEILNQHNLMINGNGLNNQQLNQNIINTQQLQHQPVYAHLNDTTQLIKQQYQAPPEYSEVVHTNNRTNGWTTQQQANQLSQPNSLDLNDWRQQQIQNDLNQLNLNTQLNGQQAVQIMNQMQPIYGHHRNSLTNSNAQLQQNAQLITQHQQLIQAQQQIQHISNGLGQNNVPNNLNTSMQPTPNNQTIQQQQQVLNSTQIQSTTQQQQLINPQQQQQQTSNQLNNNLTQQSAIPNPPSITQPQPPQLPQQNAAPNIPQPPPPPPMPPSNLSSNNSTTSSNSTINSSITNKQSGNSLASALAGAKLKKTPNKDDQKEKPNLNGGMASMLDEMTKTLARRRAQAESNNHTNGNDENDSISSRNSLKNGWDNKNKTSPNKDNDSNSRLRTGSADSSHIEFDVEKLKQDIIMEMKKEMNKIKLEIIEAIKTELSRN